ncbi:hypothetical protein M9H77_23361 [Catharanthus roseus]|uniref:Uncharacterized protein n=1 Tax=Catharanthus roseus TaxID=4058 RepID=A0ACC0AW09_CATRO|nr:hypothetical protein M9H77_23361 [Catharanthus roseus]
MHNFHCGGSNGVSSYGENKHGHGNFISKGYDDYGKFTPKRHNGVGNFSSYVMEKELGNFLKDLPISLSLNPSIMCYEVSLVELELPLESYLSHDSLLHNGSMFDLSLHDFGVMNNASIESIVVGFGLDAALFYILHNKCLGKFVENVGYASSFLGTFLENHNDFVSSNQCMTFVSGQFELSYNEQMLLNVIISLNTLFENTFGFQFYHLHFKEILKKDFENQMGTYLGLIKVNLLTFENSILRNLAFE